MPEILSSPSFIWAGIALCLMQSALFSGLNLALLGLSRLQLEVEARSGSREAERILNLRKDSNFLLTTVLWGNVAVNCMLTLLSDSVLFGASAFAFSTVGITIVGEILPQAYFSRNAMKVGAALVPYIRFFQWVLYPVARPTAIMLDYWLGTEEVAYFRESELREVIRQHMVAEDADLEQREAMGVLNYLVLDDLLVGEEGESVAPESVIEMEIALDLPLFPEFARNPEDPFLHKVHASGEKWVILTGPDGMPHLVLDADGFLRDALFGTGEVDPYRYCHRPVVVHDPAAPLGELIRRLRVEAETRHDDVIDQDVILLWSQDGGRRIITGADLLGRIMRGVVRRDGSSAQETGTPAA